MTWMRMPGESWLAAALAFVGMWIAMMLAMMLPSLMPILWRYRRALIPSGAKYPNLLVTVMATAYFFVWSVLGFVVFPTGAILSQIVMRQPSLARVVPVAMCTVLLTAGVLQLSRWKAHQLACCKLAPAAPDELAKASCAWWYGVRLGVHCIYCCASLTAVLLVFGIMDLRAMAIAAIALPSNALCHQVCRLRERLVS